MSCPTLAAVKARWILLSNDLNRHEGTSTPYARVVSHLLSRNGTDAIIGKAV